MSAECPTIPIVKRKDEAEYGEYGTKTTHLKCVRPNEGSDGQWRGVPDVAGTAACGWEGGASCNKEERGIDLRPQCIYGSMNGFHPEKQALVSPEEGMAPISNADFAVPVKRIAIYIDGEPK